MSARQHSVWLGGQDQCSLRGRRALCNDSSVWQQSVQWVHVSRQQPVKWAGCMAVFYHVGCSAQVLSVQHDSSL